MLRSFGPSVPCARHAFVVDACRHVVSEESQVASLATRPVPFALARALGKRGRERPGRHAHRARIGSKLVDESHRAALAFLTDGESWSSSALALALGASQRTVPRATRLRLRARCSRSVVGELVVG